jgi:hypothetical protein
VVHLPGIICFIIVTVLAGRQAGRQAVFSSVTSCDFKVRVFIRVAMKIITVYLRVTNSGWKFVL